MKTKSFVKFTAANAKMFWREKETVFWTFLFPILIMVLLGMAFGKAQDVHYKVGIVDQDSSQTSINFTSSLNNISYFNAKTFGESDANASLKKGDLDVVILIPKGFENATMNATINNRMMLVASLSNVSIGNATAYQNSTIFVFYSNSYQGRSDSSIAIINAVIGGINKGIAQSQDTIVLNKSSVSTVKFEFIDYMVPGIVAMSVMQTAIYSMSIPVVQFRERGTLRRLRATPITPSFVLLSRAVLSILIALAQVFIILAIAIFGFSFKITGDWASLLSVALLGTFTFIGVGFLISAVSKTSESASGLASIISMPMMFLGDVFIPIDQLPDYIQVVSRALPLTYMSDALRKIAIFGASVSDVWVDVAVLSVIGVVVFAAAIKMFRWE